LLIEVNLFFRQLKNRNQAGNSLGVKQKKPGVSSRQFQIHRRIKGIALAN
jgi:hypothetical protein